MSLQASAKRVLSKKLVSVEIDYLRKQLGEKATQQEIDLAVREVRRLPWSKIVED